MKPRTLSATAIKSFEECEAMFKATYIDGVREASGGAADLGTAIHDTCEKWVRDDRWGEPGTIDSLMADFERRAVQYGLDATMVKDGRKMLRDWYDRWEEYPPHRVISTELKESFTIKSSTGETVEVTYIWDRGDQHEDGSIEVVDYKTWRKVVDAEQMRQLAQVRIYALSAAIKFKADEPPAVWVTYDQMRTGPVSVKFTKEDNRATWNYLKEVFDRILASDGTREQVGEGCRYCVRKAGCASLHRAMDAGNIQRLRMNPELAATRLAELKAAKNATDALVSELEEFMVELLEEHEVPELTYGQVVVRMTIRKSRKAEMERIARVLGPDIMMGYPAGMSLTSLDELLAGDEIDDDTKAEVKRYITTSASGRATASFRKH
jgi:RecB family exonuclease